MSPSTVVHVCRSRSPGWLWLETTAIGRSGVPCLGTHDSPAHATAIILGQPLQMKRRFGTKTLGTVNYCGYNNPSQFKVAFAALKTTDSEWVRDLYWSKKKTFVRRIKATGLEDTVWLNYNVHFDYFSFVKIVYIEINYDCNKCGLSGDCMSNVLCRLVVSYDLFP